MTPPTDLTRWNRAGLRRLRYVDGNAARYLEDLRELLGSSTRFPDWEAVRLELEQAETPKQELARILAQYHGERGDWGWEIVRSFARACHVLTEHLDADANEGYLATATQWDNVRRLVETLDYHPAPPASASTNLILLAKTDKTGTVEAGMQVKHSPSTGGPPVIFETLTDLEVDVDLNELRLEGYGRCPGAISGFTLELNEVVDSLTIGDPVVLEHEDTGSIEARLIAGVVVGDDSTTVTLSQGVSEDLEFTKGYTLVHVKPGERLDVSGPTMANVAPTTPENYLKLRDEAIGLAPRQFVYITDGQDRDYMRRVRWVGDRHVRFDAPIPSLDLQTAYVSRARIVSVVWFEERTVVDGSFIYAMKVTGDLSYLSRTEIAVVKTGTGMGDPAPVYAVTAATYAPIDAEHPDQGGYTTLRVTGTSHLVNPQTIAVKPLTSDWQVDSYLKNDLERPFSTTLQSAIPKKTAAGDVLVVASGKRYAWAVLENLSVDEDRGEATLQVDAWQQRNGGRYYTQQTTGFTAFKAAVRVVGWDDNDMDVDTSELVFDSVPASLTEGRKLLVARDDDADATPVEAVVTLVDETTVTLDSDLTDLGFEIGNTVVHGNVVLAGHGETKPEKVLGSGDATSSNQWFMLKATGVSFVADATQSTGVRAAMDVTVGNQTWTQVATLGDSKPADAHYVVRMTEEGYLKVQFGDGTNGRRLPRGTNNVRVRYRVGSGLAGNVDARSFSKPAKANPLIEEVIQYVEATGGNDVESSESLRDTAPGTILSLERAVSIADFANLAAAHSSVWQARAFNRTGTAGRSETVDVVVVPAEGRKLGTLSDTLQSYLQEHAVPHVRVLLWDFKPRYLRITATLSIDTEQYDQDAVLDAVTSALADAFSLEQRRIGQAVYLSEVYHVVEDIEGVQHSTCSIDLAPSPDDKAEDTFTTSSHTISGPTGKIKVLIANPRQVFYLDGEQPALTVQTEEQASTSAAAELTMDDDAVMP